MKYLKSLIYLNFFKKNLWDPFDRNREGIICYNTVNHLYINQIGYILPCPYVHIGKENIFESSLKEISENGFRVNYFIMSFKINNIMQNSI